MQQRTRVLVVDDSAIIRKVVTDALGEHPSLEVVGTAPNGKVALAKIPVCRPDVLTLDIEMPEMDGLATLREVRRLHPGVRVIMVSSLTRAGARATFDALASGASDYVTKPSTQGGPAEAKKELRQHLVPKIEALGRRAGAARSAPATAAAPPPSSPGPPTTAPVRPGGRIDVVAIGVSTGGPNALDRLLPTLPRDLSVPVVIVQHMPPLFTRYLAERLDARSSLAVREGTDGAAVTAGTAWIAPGDYHMTVGRKGSQVCLRMNQEPPENSCRPAADVLFRSVLNVYGSRCLAIVLTGMGSDGLAGCRSIAAAGGQVVVQDEATSVVWGMPGSVVRAGLAQRVLPLDRIGPEIRERVAGSRAAAVAR
jgi:two-component system chemotaxis response regulator CheB